MKSRILTVILSVVLFSQSSFAQLCAALKDARCGETHTLALSEDNYLFSCGSGWNGQLGLCDIGNAPSLQRIKGLKNLQYIQLIRPFYSVQRQ
jgi:alpha-tubulin suppressor-like RCC1 family protein